MQKLQQNAESLKNKNRLRWACRRGMLELDVLFMPFVEDAYDDLDAAQQEAFRRLLTCDDPDLFAWFMGHQECEDKELAGMVEFILSRVKSLVALLRLALQPWRRFAVSTQIWGVDTETGNWMQLDDLDQRQWQAAALSWVTPWFLLVRLHQSDQPHQHRWWWCWQGWVSEADYRRLSRWLLRRREYSGLGIRK